MGAAGGVTMSNTGSTDHLSFDAVGIPGFQFIQDPLEYETRTHHSNMDTYDHLSISDMQQAAVVVAAFVYNTAMRNDMIPRKPLPKPEKFIFDLEFSKISIISRQSRYFAVVEGTILSLNPHNQ